MNTRRLRFLLIAIVSLSLCGLEQSSAAVSRPKPDILFTNILFIVADDLNTALGCYGNATVKSPNIDRLAARGVRYDRAYCQYPLCNPSRVSFLSGRRPETTGVYVLDKSARAALPDAVMLPQFFRQHGYFAGGAGKVFHSVKMNDAKSWDFYEDGNGADPQEQAALKARYASGTESQPGGGDGRPAWHVLDGDGSRTRDGLNAQTICRLIAEQNAAGKPFFLAAGFHKPHLPWTAPKRFFDLYPPGAITAPLERGMRDIPAIALQTELSGFGQPASRTDAIRGYYACISFTDHQIGLLLDQLDRLDLWKNTVVVLLGDNGFHLGDHGGLWAKLSAFDASTRVPLIFAGVGVPAGRVATAPVELLDIYPTLLELCGMAISAELEGRSLVATMREPLEKTPRTAHSMVFHYDVAAQRDVLSRTVIAGQWRYTEWDGGAAGRELYWRPDDPAEYSNLVADPELANAVSAGQQALKKLPAPKPGPANRPRALLTVAPRLFLRESADLLAARASLARGEPALQPALAALRAEADRALDMPPPSVMDKTLTAASGDKHDYFTFGPYWWPDPAKTNGLPYIRRDGELNPASTNGTDTAPFTRMCDNTESLCLAYWFTGDERYAQKAARLARVWFFDPATRMNPNLAYGQAIPGVTDGRGIGLIDFRRLADINENLALLAGSPAWTDTDRAALKSWLSDFYHWLTTSAIALDEKAARNNHGTWYDAQTAHLALVLDRRDDAKKILSAGLTNRLASQIEPDGSQPLELARTKSLNYSIFNLEGLFTCARLASRVDVDWWAYTTADGRSLHAALAYLAPYADPGKIWPRKDLHAADQDRLIPLLNEYLRHREDPALRDIAVKFAGTSGADARWRLIGNQPLTPSGAR